MGGRYDLMDFEWSVIEPLLPNKPRGVPRVNDRRVLNGIFWVLRSGAPWRGLPERYGPYTTCYNRFVRWRKATLEDAFEHFGLPLPARTLLALQWPDFLLPPARLSLFAWVMLFSGYMRGAYYPTRHFEHFLDSLVGRIEGNGGEIRLCR